MHDLNKVVEGLQNLLSDTYILYIKTQNFHWNVKGTDFGALHQLFETQYGDLAIAVDLLAERITALDGVAVGSCADFIANSSILEKSGLDRVVAEDMIRMLLEDNKKISDECKDFIEKLDKYGDEATAHIVADRITAHDKVSWMLRSHLQ